jgi:hypothetical protein
MTGKKSNTGVIAVVVLLLIVVFVAGVYTDWKFTIAPPPEEEEEGAVPVGTFSMQCAAYDTLDVATTRTVGTAVAIHWYAYRNGWVLLGSGDNINIEIEERDQGYIYVVCENNASYYTDFTKIKNMNSRVKTKTYEDVDGDSVKEWVFKYSMFSIPPSAAGYPETTFYAYLLTKSAAFAMTTPAAITGFGANTVTKYLAYYTTMVTAKTGVAVYKIELKVNSTSTTLWEIKNVNVPGVGYLSGSSFVEQTLETYTTYTYTIGSSLNDAVYWQLPSNTNDKFDLTVGIEFTNPNELGWTLSVYWLTPAEVSTKLSSTAVRVDA